MRNKFNIPLDDANHNFIFNNASNFINYIKCLKDPFGNLLIKSMRKTGFLGFIINLTNLFPLFEILKTCNMDYLLTFKLSQDFLETYFSAIRSRGGFNNNPNAKQFESAYKRLLVRHEIKEFENSNVVADGVEILFTSSGQKHYTEPVCNYDDLDITFSEHDYVQTSWASSPLIESVVEYISGFVIKKMECAKYVEIIYLVKLMFHH